MDESDGEPSVPGEGVAHLREVVEDSRGGAEQVRDEVLQEEADPVSLQSDPTTEGVSGRDPFVLGLFYRR